MKYLFLLIFLVSCATPIRIPPIYTDGAVKDLQVEFLLEADSRNIPVANNVRFIGFSDIKVYDAEKQTIRLGYCTANMATYYDNFKKVIITYKIVILDNTLLYEENYNLLKFMVYHELGHCYLNLDHSDNPKDIMYPVTSKVIFTQEEWKEMLDKMFNDSLNPNLRWQYD